MCRTRADGLGLTVVVGDEQSFAVDKDTCGVLLQYPATDGTVHDYKVWRCVLLHHIIIDNRQHAISLRVGCLCVGGRQSFMHAAPARFDHDNDASATRNVAQPAHTQAVVAKVHEANAKVVVATDLLALTMLTPPGEWGADIVIGSAQRFGVPMGYGGPHAAFLACHEEYKRLMPGRIIGTRMWVWVCFRGLAECGGM